MGEQTGPTALEEMDPEGSEEESDLDKLFESDDEMKENLKSLLDMPLEFMEDSSEDEGETLPKTKERRDTGNSVESQMEALFVDDEEQKDSTEDVPKDPGFESISENEFDGPESGECDTSDGELPDSPKVVVTLPDTPAVKAESVNGDSDPELKMEYQNRSGEYYNTVSQRISVPSNPERKVVIGSMIDLEKQTTETENKEQDQTKTKDTNVDQIKNKEKKENKARSSENSDTLEVERKKEQKIKKYLSKCLEFFYEMSKKDEENKESNDKVDTILETKKNYSAQRRRSKMKSIVEKVSRDKDNSSPHSSVSSKVDRMSLSSHSSGLEKTLQSAEQKKRRSVSLEKERKVKSSKKSKSKSKELREYKYKYKKYLQYLQSEREKCYQESLALEKQKHKVKRKRRKSSSPDKSKEKPANRANFLSFPQFCESRELISPDRDVINGLEMSKQSDENVTIKKRMSVSTDSVPSTSSIQPTVDITDDDKELFITYSDLVEQDKLKDNDDELVEGRDKIENILEADPELKSISVFTSVLFKGSSDSQGIPFLQDSRAPSPTNNDHFKTVKKFPVALSTGPDDLYDWNDDLSTISQCSLSPSGSPAPKVHNKALLNFLENQKERSSVERIKRTMKKAKYSRSRSKSPKKEKLKKRKKHRLSKSISHSPPPPRLKSPEVYKKRISPPAHLKERWKDYPSPPERRRDHYDRPSSSRRRSRSRTRLRVSRGHSHRSRSSSEERTPPRRYRSRSPPPPKLTPQPPSSTTMVHTSGTEKRRLLKEEHERALASLRATIRKPMMPPPLSITFASNGDVFDPIIRDNYDPVVMNEVHGVHRPMQYPHPRGTYLPHFSGPTPPYFYYPPHRYF